MTQRAFFLLKESLFIFGQKKGVEKFSQPQSINQQSGLHYPTISLTSAAKPLLSNLMLGPIVVVM